MEDFLIIETFDEHGKLIKSNSRSWQLKELAELKEKEAKKNEPDPEDRADPQPKEEKKE